MPISCKPLVEMRSKASFKVQTLFPPNINIPIKHDEHIKFDVKRLRKNLVFLVMHDALEKAAKLQFKA